jgi:hypothetical protein
MTMRWKPACEREADVRGMVRRMTRGDAVDPALRDHIERCASCEETMSVALWMQQLAAVPVESGPLPDPAYIWWKAELLRRWDAQQRAAAPLEVGEHVQVGVGLVAASALLVWLWRTLPDLTTSATSLTPLALVMILSGIPLAATAIVIVKNLVRRT